jgi:hypothetical protein
VSLWRPEDLTSWSSHLDTVSLRSEKMLCPFPRWLMEAQEFQLLKGPGPPDIIWLFHGQKSIA